MAQSRRHAAVPPPIEGRAGRPMEELPDCPYRINELRGERSMETLSAEIEKNGGSMGPESLRKYAIGRTGKKAIADLKLIAGALGVPFLAIFKGSEMVAANDLERDFLKWFRLVDDSEKATVVRMLKAAPPKNSSTRAQ